MEKSVLWQQVKLALANISAALDIGLKRIEKKVEAAGGGADWNANEGEPGHVKNRTHYVGGTTKVPIFVDITVEGYGNNGFAHVGEQTLNVGDKYIVEFEGKSYECEARAFVGYTDAVYIGNGKIIEEGNDVDRPLPGNGEPFVFAHEASNSGLFLLMNEPVSTRTFSIYHMEETVKKIDPKYLPEMAPNLNLENGEAADSMRSKSALEEGDGYQLGESAFAYGPRAEASGDSAIALGRQAMALGNYSFAEGMFTKAEGSCSHAEGDDTIAFGDTSHAEGNRTLASGHYSHAEGRSDTWELYVTGAANAKTYTLSSSNSRVQVGRWIVYKDVVAKIVACENKSITLDKTLSATALSYESVMMHFSAAAGQHSHAEGAYTNASGTESHAEGNYTEASGQRSHAEGNYTKASGQYSHAEGDYTTASGTASHAEGMDTVASAPYSHAEGCGTKSESTYQHVQGKFNVKDTENKYAHIVGNGEDGLTPSNAHTLDWDGNAWFKGKVFVGGNSMDDGAVELGAGGGTGGAEVRQLAITQMMDSLVYFDTGELVDSQTAVDSLSKHPTLRVRGNNGEDLGGLVVPAMIERDEDTRMIVVMILQPGENNGVQSVMLPLMCSDSVV